MCVCAWVGGVGVEAECDCGKVAGSPFRVSGFGFRV